MAPPAFRLNAPQAEESQAEVDAFGGIADDVEDPPSEPFSGSATGGPNHMTKAPSARSMGQQSIDPQIQELLAKDPRLAAAYLATQQQQQQPMMLPPEQAHMMMYQQQQRQGMFAISGNDPASARRVKILMVIGVLVILLLIGLIVAVVVVLGGNNNNISPADMNLVPTLAPVAIPTTPLAPSLPTTTTGEDVPVDSFPTTPPNSEPTPEPKTTLGRVFQRGFLRCGVDFSNPGFSVQNVETGDMEGFDVDLCRAVASAVFGEPKVEFVRMTSFQRFTGLDNDDYDVLSATTTHTMERQVSEPTTGGSGFSFSTPYLYNGLQFAGQMPYVECADNFTVTTDECQDTKICVIDGTTHVQTITANIPNVSLVSVVRAEFMYSNFASGTCNVIANEQFNLAEQLVRDSGYSGEYFYGGGIHSKEPLALVTRNDDPEWSDLVNWVVQAILAAEEEGVTASSAMSSIPDTVVFGDTFAKAFANAVAAVGNYFELYQKHLEPLLPRPKPDFINTGDSGVIYAMPFGDLARDGPSPYGTLAAIRERGFLKCGISRRVIFAQLNATSGEWNGFDVDFCKALSAALFDGETETVVYTDLPASERFLALKNGDVDVLSRLTTLTLSRDILETDSQVGFSFAQPNFYDGLTFGGVPPFPRCAERLDITSVSCSDLKICVNEGTTFESILQGLFRESIVVPKQSGELTVEGLVNGDCNAIAGGISDVSLTNIRSAGYDGSYEAGSYRFSKDPLALATRQDDVQWSNFVYWIVSSIYYAEEQDIKKNNAANRMPQTNLFGPEMVDMFRLAVGAVGNYGEIYKRQVEADVPRGGLNTLNTLLDGPQHYPLPGIF